MPKPGFYAVRIGRQPGVYVDWKACKAQITGFPNAKHKKFISKREAQEFVDGIGSIEELPKSDSESKIGGQKRLFAEIEDESGYDVVYSDGACKGNGNIGSVAGLGVWWGEGDPRNIAERCPGEQTNNRAELIAILRVLENTPISKKPLLIKTDSQYSINCFQSWIHNWRARDWKTASGTDVKNEGIIRCISKHLDIRAKRGQKVRLQYVKGHSGEVGNDGADRLANEGAFMPPNTQEPDWKLMENQLEEVMSNILESESATAAVRGPDDAARPSLLGIPREPRTPPMGDDQATDLQEPPLKARRMEKRDSTQSAQSLMFPKSGETGRPFVIPTNPQQTESYSAASSREPSSSQPFIRAVDTNPPLVPVRAEVVNFEDYADCILDDDDLAKELLG